ncbi:MAG: phosphomevalonate kinase [Aerococcaceae bacterium]|nr:phosphomevalonate kinase [Aerococcaceae bacterium]
MNFLDLFDLNPALTFQKITAHVPGKLFIAGEYAVLEAGTPAILVAVNQYLHCTIQLSLTSNHGLLQSNLPELTDYAYQRVNARIPEQPQWRYVLAAIETVETLLSEMNRPLQDYRITISSELVSQDGKKYGLGSSGAVTVATIRALLSFYGLVPRSREIVYKLAAIALVKNGNLGSLGDIASNCYGGWLYYQSPSRTWLRGEIAKGTPFYTLLHTDWEGLALEPLTAPEQLTLLVGWTQSPASTDHFIQLVQDAQANQHPFYQAFIQKSAQCVQRMKHAFEAKNVVNIQSELANSRHLLQQFGHTFGLSIQTDALEQLIEIARSYQFEAKSSGAGGGDCGIAIGMDRSLVAPLIKAWQQEAITPLSIDVAPPIH